MLDILLCYGIIGLALICSEITNRLYFQENTEIARKIVHVFGGIASLSLIIFTTQPRIAFVAFSCVPLMIFIRKKKLLMGLRKVDRSSLGEVFFPVGVGFTALIAQSSEAYVFAILGLTFADTIAAIVGGHYAKRYHIIFGSKKSFLGAMSLAGSLIIIGVFIMVTGQGWVANLLPRLLLISLVGAVVEFCSVHGFDNVSLPAVLALCWSVLL